MESTPQRHLPRCGSAPESFAHAILHCPNRARERSLLLGEVTSLDGSSPLWTSRPLIQALGRYIMATHTGFPPDMYPLSPRPTPSPNFPLSPANELNDEL